MAGRPLTLTPEVHDLIIAAVDEGSPFTDSYLLAGVSTRVGELWRTRAFESRREDITDEFTHLADEMDIAKAQYKKRLIGSITRAGEIPEFWTAAIRLLQSRDPVNFSLNAAVERSSYNKDLGLVEQTEQLLDDIASGKIHSEEALRVAEVIEKLVRIKIDIEVAPLIKDLQLVKEQLEGIKK